MCTINESIYIIIMSNYNKKRFQSKPKKYANKVRMVLAMEDNVGPKPLPYNISTYTTLK